MRRVLFVAGFSLLTAIAARSQTVVDGRQAVVLDSDVARVVVDVGGGSIVQFHFHDQKLNPLVWNEADGTTGPRQMAHFLCLDRWGAPSEAEGLNGMPYHGEAALVNWEVVQSPQKRSGAVHAEMAASLPMAGLDVKRKMILSADRALLWVHEEVTNKRKLGRIYNWVQHPTIGPPFLDENTVVDANARKGFMQSSPMPNPEQPTVVWPQALKDGQPVNLRHLIDDPWPNVVSYTIDEEYGWATASNPSKGLLIGYLWKTEEYPWFNAWRHVDENRKPLARGLEFGTTGLHQPFSALVEKGRIFGRPLFAHIETGQTVTKSYANFLFKIPPDYEGVARATYASGKLTLHERRTEGGRDLTIQVGDRFER